MRTLALAWRDALVASDPGWLGLRMGLRAMLAASLSAALLASLAHLAHAPTAAMFAGIMLAMMGASVVNDTTRTAQAITLLLVLPVAGGALILGTLLAPHRWVAAAVLLAVIFVGVYLRRHGPRWTTLGLLAFFGYFFSVFLHLKAAQLAPTLIGIAAALAVAFGVRFGLVRETAEGVLGGALASFGARVTGMLGALASWLQRPGSLRRRRAVRRRLALLNEAALELEERLDPANPDAALDLRTRVFELELSVEALAESAGRLANAPEAERLAAAQALREARWSSRPPAGPLGEALQTLHQALAAIRQPPQGVARAAPARSSPAARGPALRQALQATLATGLALVAGNLLSPVRWYWAVIGAFVVFSRATTVAETSVRAVNRAVGTVAGVVAGLGFAEVVRGHSDLELALIFVFIFIAYWLFRISYAWMVLWITAVLAIFYELLGMLTPGVLWLRIEETLVGCACGVLASAVLLPSHTRDRVRARSADVLDTLAAGLGRMHEAAKAGRAADLLDLARELDREVRELRDAARPLTGRFVRWGPSPSTRPLHAVLALTYYARLLASDEDALASRCAALGEVASGARALAARLRGDAANPALRFDSPLEPGCSPRLVRMRQLLTELAAELAQAPAALR